MPDLEIMWTKVDEAPALATYSLLPIVEAFVGAAGVSVKLKDISLTGVGLYLPRVLPGPQVRLDFITPTRPEGVQLCGNCVRVQRCADGRYQAGVAFL